LFHCTSSGFFINVQINFAVLLVLVVCLRPNLA